MFKKRCPRADELEALVTGRRVSSRVIKHVPNCETCYQIVAALREDAAMLAELREAANSLDSRTRQRLLDLCRNVGRPPHSVN